jgi:hypothetical protein
LTEASQKVQHFAAQNLQRQRVLYQLLDRSLLRTRPEVRVEADGAGNHDARLASPQSIVALRGAEYLKVFESFFAHHPETVMDTGWHEVAFSWPQFLFLIPDLHHGSPRQDITDLFLSVVMITHLARHKLDHAELGRAPGDCFYENARALLSVLMLC